MFLSFFFLFYSFVLSDVQEVNLGNEYLSLSWNIDNSLSLKTKDLLNQRADPKVTVIPQSGSEEFTISILRENASPYPSPITDKSKWKISSNSEKSLEGDDGPIKNLIDNNPSTIWHCWESSKDDKTGHDDRPDHKGEYNITIDLGEKISFKAISFTQKPVNIDGVVRQFKLYVGNSLEDVTQKVKENKFSLDSYFAADKNNMCYLNLTEEVNAQFIVIVTKGDGKFATGAQFDIYDQFLPYVNDIIKASELKCSNYGKGENSVSFIFDTYELNGAKYDITEIVELIEGKPYMEKHLEIKISDENVRIDYIDLDHYVLTDDDRSKSWGSPLVDELFMSLGQPYYMNTFYAGCRFPYTHTMIESSSNLARIRYYTGKAFRDVPKNDKGAYVTWKTVLGAARDSRIEVVRNDFFSYITDISVPSPFRKQYNSWYDWMLRIDEENIMTSFKEIERGCSQYGLPPFDSYVVDDGWNNYNSDKYDVYDEGTSGTTYNQGGFWEFNNKFPNLFKNPSDFTRKISSNFGVWLGPRGGYVTPGKFGKMIEDANNGYYNSRSDDIDVASHTYLRNVQKLLVDFIRTYKVNYYKLDGFVEQPCFNETHDHMVGGPDGAYFFTDLWENVYIWYEDMIQTAKETGLDNFWISTTTWAAPSPFQLQWSNSVWIQVSGDLGEIIIGDNNNQADQMLTYRDDCYWQFYDDLELQFPARCLYNHDPIYGQAGTSLRNSLNDDYFRTFLYGCAMRGTAFFELYYTYDMLDEGDKWYISSDVLSWAERNFDTLQHSQIFGGRPGIGEFYGFSAWNETNGVIGLRNPGTETVKETINLDRNIGVPEAIGTVYRCTLLDHQTKNDDEVKNKEPFKYGDELKVTLVPGEYRIYEFRPNYDQDPPQVEVIKSTKENEIMLRFNKRILIDDAKFLIEGIDITDIRLRGDRRTVTLTTSPMVNYTKYDLQIQNVKDIFDNVLSQKVQFQYFAFNAIANVRGEFSGADSVIVGTTVNTDSFTIRLNVKDFKGVKDADLLHSEDNSIIVGITNDNHIRFQVGDTIVVSESDVNNDIHYVTLVRERNGLIKIYFETEIDSSSWDSKMPVTVNIHNIVLNKNDVVYNYVNIFNYGFAYSEVSKEVSLKNEFIERVFSISNNKVKTVEINNYRTESITTIKPSDGSEEFLFSVPAYAENNGINEILRLKNEQPIPIDRTEWRVTANSEQTNVAGREGAAVNMIDGNLDTIWHSKYSDAGEGGHDDRADTSDPFQLIFDLGKETSFKAFSYTPRKTGTNGRINHYEIYVAKTLDELNKFIKEGTFVMKGDFHYLSTFPVYANFTTPQSGKFVALLSVNHSGLGSGADFSLYSDFVPLPYTDIKSSSFDLDHYEQTTQEDVQKLSFIYKPYTFDSIQFNITVEYELQKGKPYIEKQIIIRIPENKYKDAKFDYIDLEHIIVSNDDKANSWTHPYVDSTQYDLLNKYILMLGQPVYINSLFTGCRFPFADNQIEENIAHLRYHTGKSFSQFELDKDGSYRCWKTVIGAARSKSIEVVRNDFYSYITDISVENKFRKQYNSWYDWMLSIDEANILTSFKEIEKSCSQHGVRPLDSYVIDDGWNNYNYNSSKYYVYNPELAGTTFNDVGFWEINDKFPDGFNKPSIFTRQVSSNFGVWLGPRGGYNFNAQFGHMIEESGFGYFNAATSDIDVGSTKYTEHLKQFWNKWIEDYKVNYYKLDGWALRPCDNKDHDHMVGGYNGVYYYTDYWERYIKVFESMRKTAIDNQINNLWISLTCYINPSPFHLQWANSIWIQLSKDVDYTQVTPDDTYADKMLNYRDTIYYKFYDIYQFQLPQQSLYNHDPIYGKTGTPLENALNDDEFRKYLLMCGMRGNSFFELYYSYTMVDEGDKWYVNSEVLNYIENRHEVLRNSQRFGGSPEKGDVYGYSAWSNDKGTIAIRNPSAEAKQYEIKLDREIGVPENIQIIYRKTILDYNTKEDLGEGQQQSYGDIIKVTLQPREVRIIDFEPMQDDKCAEIEVVKAVNQKEIQIRFNKKIKFDISNYAIDHDIQILGGKLRGDLRTVSIYLENPFENNTEYTISLNNVLDSLDHQLNVNVSYIYMAGNMIVTVPQQLGPVKYDGYLSEKEHKVESFTVHLSIQTNSIDGDSILIQDKDNKVTVEIVNRRIKFTVKSLSLLSDVELSDDNNSTYITCVRERNTMLKIYIDGVLSNSVYSEDQDSIVTFNAIKVIHSDIVYNSLSITSYGFSYKDVLEANEDMIRVSTATAEASSEQEGHEARYAIDDNENTYWLSQNANANDDQYITISFDRIVFIDQIKYKPHDDSTAIQKYTVSVSLNNSEWINFPGQWGDENEKIAFINQSLKYLRLSGSSKGNSPISVAQLYFYGHETENEDTNPKHEDKDSVIWVIFGAAAAAVFAVIIGIIIFVELKKKKSSNFGYSEPLISYEKSKN